ncbi:RecQ family ATP-dependent DNA helicase [Thaumasiovibrio subtropicus]|uniref:RecQ family ATP-dependent DNA helicase n=1 Tax=Thaumasiovibrio subtropicus TaxID=1891207 RepID=UPI000B35A699|nr:RecQ family ATP-dependent DNA helicase [Thaumasiovibrio subtropicus]
MIETTLQNVFGFTALRDGQKATIDKVLQHKSCAAIFPTGSGKSLCYQLPALHLPHLTLVISPLLALMKDQLAFLQSKGIAAATLDSTQTPDEAQAVIRGVTQGEIRILMVSVERLKNERFREMIKNVPISMLVVDEAHCISEWGHNFRPDYLMLPTYRAQFNIPQVLLLTATATPAVIRDMRDKFTIAEDDVVLTGFYRPNLALNVIAAESNKLAQLTDHVLHEPQSPTIIYVTLQQTAEAVASHLIQQGINAAAYHAGLESTQREHIQDAFMANRIDCVVATIAFGMGVDKANIRRVFHFDLPKSIENYSQEIGRAGRDGLSSTCTVFADLSGITVLENFVFGDTPERSAIDALLAQIPEADWHVKLHSLSNETNIRQLVLKTLLVYLEMEGIIEMGFSYFAEYRFKTLQPVEAILAKFQGERQQFVEQIFRASPKARTWHQVDFDRLWHESRGERKRAIRALNYFEELGLIQLETKQMTDVYHVRQPHFDRDMVASTLTALTQTKEQAAIERIDEMVQFFSSERCLSYRLADYFGDTQSPRQPTGCGHCSVCLGQPAVLNQPENTTLASATQVIDWCQPLIAAASKHEITVTETLLCRFLCGLTTPFFTRLKARQMVGFGQLSAMPFRQCLALIESSSILSNATIN